MTKADWEFVLRMFLVITQVGFAGIVASQVILRSRESEFISSFERKYASISSLVAAVLLLAGAAITFAKDGPASMIVYHLTTAAVLAHFVGVIGIHLVSLYKHGRLKLRSF
ncbi:MAG: hypothetical protein ACRELE_06555 [Gemmatimonadales bacterium]